MKNMNKSHSSLDGESGRSMVEMLGVLAIIGVLSVGGIAGYTMAMNKHKANELLNEASMRAVAVSGYLLSGKEGSIAEFTDPSGYQFGYATVDGENQFKLTLKTSAGVKIDESICAQIKNVVGGEHINPSVNDECTELIYNNDLGDGSAGAPAASKPCTCPSGKSSPCVETADGCDSKYYIISGDTHEELEGTNPCESTGGKWASIDDIMTDFRDSDNTENPCVYDKTCKDWPSGVYGWLQECVKFQNGSYVKDPTCSSDSALAVDGNGTVSTGSRDDYFRADATLCVR